MAGIVTSPQYARTIEIDNELVGFTTEDIRMARAHSGLSGVRGQLGADKIEAWFRDGQPSYEIESNSGPTNGDEIVGTLVYRKVGKSGVLGQKEYTEPITREDVRKVRNGKRGRASGADMLAAVRDRIEKEWSPVHIETPKGELHNVNKDGDELSTSKDEVGTIRLLQERIAQLENQLAAQAESTEDETESE